MKETIVMFRKNEEGMLVQLEGKGAAIMAGLTILIAEFAKHNGYDPKEVAEDLFRGVANAEALRKTLEVLKGGGKSE